MSYLPDFSTLSTSIQRGELVCIGEHDATRMTGGKCNVQGCSCTGYTKGDSAGTCACGHLARDHI